MFSDSETKFYPRISSLYYCSDKVRAGSVNSKGQTSLSLLVFLWTVIREQMKSLHVCCLLIHIHVHACREINCRPVKILPLRSMSLKNGHSPVLSYKDHIWEDFVLLVYLF